MYIEIDENNKILGYSDKPNGSSIETNEQLPTYSDVQILKFIDGKFVVEGSKELADKKTDWIANQYQRDRASAYPSMGDQLDMIYWDKKNGTEKWKQCIDAVKQAHPKTEESSE